MSKQRIVISTLLLIVVGLVALLVVGCGESATTTTGGSGSGDTSTSATVPDAGEQPSGDTIPIGILTSYTGEMGAFGVPWFNAAKMAAEDVNAAGGVLGKKISLSTEDDRSSVEEGIKGARKLIGVNKVVAIHGPISDVVIGVYPIAKDNKVVVSSEASGSTRLDTGHGDFFFRTCPSDSFDGRVAAEVMWEQGYKEIGLMYENDEGRRSIGAAVKAEFEKLGGKVVEEVAFTPRQATYSAELRKLAAAKPEIVWLGSGQESGATLLKNAKQSGYSWKWMLSSDMAVPEMFGLVGNDVLEGVMSETPSADTENQYFKDWAARFQSLFNSEPTGAFQSNSYDAVIIHALAMQKAGEATGAAIAANFREVANPPGEVVHSYEEGLAALKAGKDINYEGMSGPCDLDENGNTVGSYTSLIGKAGKWEVVKFYPAETFLAK